MFAELLVVSRAATAIVQYYIMNQRYMLRTRFTDFIDGEFGNGGGYNGSKMMREKQFINFVMNSYYMQYLKCATSKSTNLNGLLLENVCE